MDHITFLALLSKENLVQIASMLLTENIALKSRLEQMETRIKPIEELNTNVYDWLHQSNQSVSQSQTATSLEEADNNNVALRKLFVRNISFQATPQDLAVAFSKYGNVEYAKIQYQTNKYGYVQSRGYGFVIYSQTESANRALRDKIVLLNGRPAECYLSANGGVRPANRHQ